MKNIKLFESFLNENAKGPTSGNEELDVYLNEKYPDFEIYPCKSWEGEICTGIIAKQDDSTLNKAFVYYWNTNYELTSVVVKKYPC